jgi:hypothetical protein
MWNHQVGDIVCDSCDGSGLDYMGRIEKDTRLPIAPPKIQNITSDSEISRLVGLSIWQFIFMGSIIVLLIIGLL